MNIWYDRLRELRQKRGVTQKELAEYLNVSQIALSYWERGQREPSIDMITRIANYFHVSVDYLMTGKEVGNSRDICDNSIDKIIDRMDAIGYTFRADSEGNIWLEYPDGTPLNITEKELLELIDETDSYLKFRLEELRRKKQK